MVIIDSPGGLTHLTDEVAKLCDLVLVVTSDCGTEWQPAAASLARVQEHCPNTYLAFSAVSDRTKLWATAQSYFKEHPVPRLKAFTSRREVYKQCVTMQVPLLKRAPGGSAEAECRALAMEVSRLLNSGRSLPTTTEPTTEQDSPSTETQA